MNTLVYPPPSQLVIATRESRLALWQAEHVRAELLRVYPQCAVSLLGMTTRGDQVLDRPLAKVGGKGLFVKELETALAAGHADLAVHSLKDVPMQLPSGFVLAAIGARENPLDAYVSNKYAALEEMPPGAIVGTSSLRREAQLRAQYPWLVVSSLRGNLDTRLKKLDAGQFDAIILAAAGLTRLGLGSRIRALLPAEVSLPAAGQGALGFEICTQRRDSAALLTWLAPLNDVVTAACVSAERAVARALAGHCEAPLGAYCTLAEASDELYLRGLVATPDGQRMVRSALRGPSNAPEALGQALAVDLMEQGAKEILASLDSSIAQS